MFIAFRLVTMMRHHDMYYAMGGGSPSRPCSSANGPYSETIMSFFSILLENCFRQKSENYNVGSSAAFQSYSMIADYEAHLYLQIVIVRSVISPPSCCIASERREGSQKIRKSGWIFQFVLLDVLRLLTCIVIQTVPYDTLKDTTRPFSPTFSDLFFFRENS